MMLECKFTNTGAALSVSTFFVSDVNKSQLAGLLKCKEFINVDIICVANTVNNFFKYVYCSKRLKSSVINFSCKLYDLIMSNSPNRRKRVTSFLAACIIGGLIVMMFGTGLG